MLAAGKLRHRITFQNLVITIDPYGGQTQEWQDFVTVWAEVLYSSVGSREFWDAQKANSEAQGVVRIRHREDITPEMRIKYGSKLLHVLVPFTYDPKNWEMRILFKEALD